MLCSRCKKRPAVVFIATNTNSSNTQGLCLTCAKELGIKPGRPRPYPKRGCGSFRKSPQRIPADQILPPRKNLLRAQSCWWFPDYKPTRKPSYQQAKPQEQILLSCLRSFFSLLKNIKSKNRTRGWFTKRFSERLLLF